MAFTSSQIPSSSALTPTRWDVFLSFRGPDTRFNFTSHLYAALHGHGIQTYKDDPELRTGEVISDALIQAIQESKTYIVVFSENYASSPWCLDELVEIYTCHETMKRSIIVVYYHVDPGVIRHQTGCFRNTFEKHKDRFADEKVNKWRSTLKQVAGLSGKHIPGNRSEADFINEIVHDILIEINPKTLDVAKYPIGLDSRVKSITTLLSNDDTEEGVIKFGLYGMGGVGKTTLAKAVYNQLLGGRFKGSCFLSNVREVTGTTNGLISLQQQLFDDVLKSKNIVKVQNIDQGTKLIRDRVCSTKILVVIDDIDHYKQYESLVGPFACGSVVIITTRDEEILEQIKVETRYRYMVNALDYAESLTLFTQHAFENAKPNNKLMVLSEDILSHAGGLPLALEVYGSYLYEKSEAQWKHFIDKLQRIPNNDIHKRLSISLDAIGTDDPLLKKMFLDIACFFIGWKKEEVITVMKTYYSYADVNIDILKKRCLLNITKRDELRMHDLLRDMGRRIVQNDSPDNPGKHSRLWVFRDICNVLKRRQGTEAIEAIINQYFRPKHTYLDSKDALEESITTETFTEMSKLRFLHLVGVKVTGCFEHKLGDLRWLRWDCYALCYLPSGFYPQELVSLELPCSKLKTMWQPDVVPQVFHKLKTLDMSNSQYLTSIPDLSNFPSLETLNLKGCKSLQEVHISKGTLVSLVSLNLHGCEKLRSLPDNICNLRSLKVLDISGCTSLKALPADLGNIKSLTVLNASGLNVSNLPDSIGHLSKLVELRLSYNKNLKTLPESICTLRALRILDIGNCSSLEALPVELGNMESLTELNVSSLTVSELPDTIERLSKLVRLRLSGNGNGETLSNTNFNVRALEILHVGGFMKQKELFKTTSLWELEATCAKLLKKHPDIESNKIMSSLKILDQMANYRLTTLPLSISQLSGLGYLDLTFCRHLLSIADLPGTLKVLKAEGCESMERLPNVSNLKQLEVLDITDCSSLTEIRGIEGLTSIKILHLRGCNSFLMANTFTKRFFQIYSGFGHEINIYTFPEDFPEWISQSSILQPTLSSDLLPNVSHNLLGMLLCFCHGLNNTIDSLKLDYSVKSLNTTTTSDFMLGRVPYIVYEAPVLVIVPRSIFSVKDGDDRIEITAKSKISGIHLLYKP